MLCFNRLPKNGVFYDIVLLLFDTCFFIMSSSFGTFSTHVVDGITLFYITVLVFLLHSSFKIDWLNFGESISFRILLLRLDYCGNYKSSSLDLFVDYTV